MIQQRSSSSLFRRRLLWAVLACAGISTLWCCPPSVSFAERGVCPPSKAQPWCISLWLTGLKAPTNQLITLQGTLKNGFGEAVMVCDMSDPGKFLSLDSCQKRFLWTKSCLCSTKYLSLLKWNQGKRNALHVTASRKSGIFTLPTPPPSTPTFWLPY